MIVARVADPYVRRALRAAANPEEDVVSDPALVADALHGGFPRLLVSLGGADGPDGPEGPTGVPVLRLDDALLQRWESERRMAEVPRPRVEFLASRLSALIDGSATPATWVDSALADLSRAAGARLPAPLRTFARRIMEFPEHYTTLHDVAEACGVSRGALKARFRRRGLSSPYTYQRWFRIMSVAAVLSDRSVTVGAAAHRLGFTSSGNLCRMMGSLVDLTPTEVRTVRGWQRLLISFAWVHLTPEALEAWSDLGRLFQRQVA